MYSFGNIPVRSLKSFGVAGLLSKDAQVFYSALFSMHHLGRISDLLAARLQNLGVDELRLRTFLIIGVFQAYRAQYIKKKQEKASEVMVSGLLDKPLLLECGYDDEKVAVGVCFNLSFNIFFNTEGLSERILQKKPTDPFEEMLIDLEKLCDRLVVRFQPETRRAELVLILGIPGKIDPKVAKSRQPITVVVLENGDLQAAPKPKSYYEMGDLNFESLLDESLMKKHPLSMPKMPQMVEQPKSEPKLEQKLEQKSDQKDQKTDQKSDQKGQQVDQAIKDETLAESDTNSKANVPQLVVQPQTIVAPTQDDTRKKSSGLKSFFKRAKNKVDHFLDSLWAGSQESQKDIEIQQLLIEVERPNEKAAQEVEQEIEHLLTEVESSKINIPVIQDKFNSFQKEIRPKKAEKWMSKMIQDFAAERARLVQLTQKIGASSRMKERQYKDRIAYLEKEMSGEAFSSSQKMLNAYKEKSRLLEKHVNQLKESLSAAQGLARSNSPGEEFAALQLKLERSNRQLEELKLENRNLSDRPESKFSQSSIKLSESETDIRLKDALNQVDESKKESDVMKSRVSTLLQQEKNLKSEVIRLQAMIKSFAPPDRKS